MIVDRLSLYVTTVTSLPFFNIKNIADPRMMEAK
jgi:hypothetical protein